MTIGGKNVVQATVRDITSQQKAEAELAEHNEELEKLNKMMIGRELKMIELKKEIAELKKSPTEQVDRTENRFQAGIELEESVVQSLAGDYKKMVEDSDLDQNKKNKIIDNLEILLTDSRHHEQLLRGLV